MYMSQKVFLFMFKLKQNQYIYLIVLLFLLLVRANPCLAELTLDDEKKLGKEFYDKMEESHLILRNKVLDDYITKIGNLLQTQANKVPFKFRFLIVNSDAINAFNTPGGYVYINKGLILAANHEAELAAVIAHELGHANGRHVADMIEKSKKLNIAAMAALIAGAFLGGGGEMTAAITSFSVAGVNSMALKYSREHEEEADRLGIGYLVSAGYDPEAMIDFLKMIKQYEFLSKTMPSYLQTHPGTDHRIYYLDSLIASQNLPKGSKSIIGNFKRIQAAVPLDTATLNSRYYQLSSALNQDPDNLDLLYNLAAAEEQLGYTDAAVQHYLKILNRAPNDVDSLKNIGALYVKIGQPALAIGYLSRLLKLDPQNDDGTFMLGRAYYDTGDYRKALDCYLKIKDKTFDGANMNYYLAMTYGRLNNQGESHYYFGRYFKEIQKTSSALFHFKEALNYFPQHSVRYEDITNEIKQLKSPSSKK